MPRNSLPLFFTIAILSFFTATTQANQPLNLVKNSTPNAIILVDQNAPPTVQHAAIELSQFLKQITGANFPRLHKPITNKLSIAVGPKSAKSLDPNFNTKGLASDGIAIQVIPNKGLILAGGQPRGTLYAVYTFLDEQLGCRWWTSKSSHIPHQPTINIDAKLNIRYRPPLEYRYPFWTDAFDANWAVRNRTNGSNRLDEKRGRFMSHGGVHTFFRLIPPNKYFATHPKWFSEIKGKRQHKRAQLCLSNPLMRNELINNLKAHIKRHPTPPVYSVSQNDWHGYCTCSKCNALSKQFGGQTGVMIHFVNQVAKAIEKDFPEAIISTLAYQYTRKPPVNIRPRKNVVIQLCSIECSFSVPLTDQRNAKFRDDIVGWSKVADRLYIWDYTTDFRHYFLPHPNLRVLGDNVRFFVNHHAAGIFEQGAYTSLGAEFAELRAWVLARLLWNPKLDDQKLIAEFCHGYYGQAAPHLLKYIEVIHNAAAKNKEYARCLPSYRYNFPFLSFDVLDQSWSHMLAAAKAVEGNKELTKRIELAQLPVLYAFMWKWDTLKTQAKQAEKPWPLDKDIHKVAAHFKRIAKQHQVTRVNEWYDGFGLVDQSVKRAKK